MQNQDNTAIQEQKDQKQKDKTQSPSTIKIFKRLWPMINPYKWGLVAAGVGLVANGVVEAKLISLLKPLLDEGFGKADVQFMRLMAFLILVFIFARGLANFVSSYCLAWVSGKVVMDMRRKIFHHIMYMPASFFDKNSSGKLISRITYDSQMLASASSNTLTSIVRDSVYVISLIATMFYNSWKLSCVLFVIAPFVIVCIRVVSKKFRELGGKSQNSMGDLTASAEQMLKGHRVVLSFGGQDFEDSRFRKVSNDLRRMGMRVAVINAIANPVVQIVASISLSIILFLASMPEVVGNHLTAGEFTVIFSAMFAMLRPIRSLTNVNTQFQQGMAACQSLFNLLDLEIEKDNGTYEANPAQGHVEFKNVSFYYESRKDIPAIKNLSFSIPKGKTVALVGQSGSGKTTIANLITRFYDLQAGWGEITLDGVNINEYKLANLRQNCAMVSQSVHLFNDTIANNIAYAAKDKYSREEIIKAAQDAHAMEFIEKLEHGIDTMIGENGMNLSGGQRQRLAIARALLRKSPVLILDEATSALDTESERAIQKALEEIQKYRTVLIIAHRLSTIERADNIIVLEHGHIIEQGNHKELLAKNGRYKELYSMQFSSRETSEAMV